MNAAVFQKLEALRVQQDTTVLEALSFIGFVLKRGAARTNTAVVTCGHFPDVVLHKEVTAGQGKPQVKPKGKMHFQQVKARHEHQPRGGHSAAKL